MPGQTTGCRCISYQISNKESTTICPKVRLSLYFGHIKNTHNLTLNIIIRQCLWSSGDDIVLIPIGEGYAHYLSIRDKTLFLNECHNLSISNIERQWGHESSMMCGDEPWNQFKGTPLQLFITNTTVTSSSLDNYKIDTSYWTRFCSLQFVKAILLTQLAGINCLPPWEGEEGDNTLLKTRT